MADQIIADGMSPESEVDAENRLYEEHCKGCKPRHRDPELCVACMERFKVTKEYGGTPEQVRLLVDAAKVAIQETASRGYNLVSLKRALKPWGGAS